MGAVDELLAELGDDRQLLLADRLDARVGVGQLDAAQPVEDPHHLLLVDHHAVGLFQDFLHHGVRVLGLLAAVLDLDVVVDHAAFQRAGAVQGVGGDDVAEVVGLHPLQAGRGCRRFRAGRCPSSRRGRAGRTSPGRPAGSCRDRSRSPVVCSISSTALERIVRFRRPRKSIFKQAGPLDVAHGPLGDRFPPCPARAASGT